MKSLEDVSNVQTFRKGDLHEEEYRHDSFHGMCVAQESWIPYAFNTSTFRVRWATLIAQCKSTVERHHTM
jgi:hypothetical protein